MPERYTGAALPRVEDAELLAGAATFVDDLELEGTLHVAFARSPYAHAGITGVRKPGELSGVGEVLLFSDLSGFAELTPRIDRPGVYSPPRPLLARDRVRFVGESVAAAVAADRDLAEDACDLVEVDYQELPAVASVEAALAAGAPLLHPTGSNVLLEVAFDSGGVDAALSAAPVRLERRLEVARIAPSPMECRAVVAEPTAEGVTVWTSTQAPHQVRRALEPLLGVSVRVICPQVGGGFGQKAHVYPEEVLVAWLALRHGRPVKWVEDRRENLLASSQARGQVVSVRVAADRDGRLLALEADVLSDMGAYGVWPHGHILEALGTPNLIPGPYRLPAYRYRTRAVATNKAPGGAYRGVGVAVSAFVHERVMDLLAAELGLDPAEVRRRNLVPATAMPYRTVAGLDYDSGDYPAALEAAVARIEDAETTRLREAALAAGRRFGVGLACYVETTGMGSEVFARRGMVDIAGYDEARVTINADGSATLVTTLPSAGQGLATSFAQLLADELSLPLAAVRVERVDTAAISDGTGTFGSRSAAVGAPVILAAAETVRNRLRELAAAELEVGEWDLVAAAGRLQVAGVPERSRTYAQLAAGAPPGHLDVRERYDPSATAFAYGTHACAVEVDPGTGQVRILRYVVVEDSGPLINPLLAAGQTHGATAQGIGAALLEAVCYGEDGQPLTATLADYLLPLASDLPTYEIEHLAHTGPNPGGYKGVAEGGTVAAPAAVANAVARAIGAPVDRIPITPQTVLDLIHKPQEDKRSDGE
ncbi:MAG TPA: xanthine dehydrogenase family protein molybdopterin-binding subunit [Candidatus Dormibacteraeota bacterium]